MPNQPHPAGGEGGAGLPRGQQILDDREQLLLGRIPRLEQVVVKGDLVDRVDRRFGIGVGGEQHAFGRRHDLPRAHEVIRARQPRHPLVGH
jgi:hypothetical protein